MGWEDVPSGGADEEKKKQGTWVDVPEKPKASIPESLVRGGVQGLTSGWGEEAGAFIEHVLTGRDYKQSRDESRAANAAAKSANPVSYGVGDVGGGVAQMFIPGLNVAGKAGAVGRIATGAALGAIGGAGYSEGQTAQDVGEDALKGAGTGAVLGTVLEGGGRLVRGAVKRADNRVMQGITEGAKPSTAENLVGRAGARRPDVLESVREDPALLKAVRSGDADKKFFAAEGASERLNQARDIYYTQVDKTGARIDPTDAMGRVMAVQDKLRRNPATVGLADALDKPINDIARGWDKSAGLTAREFREEVSALQGKSKAYYKASQTGGVAPEAAQANKIAADTLRDMLHEHVEAVAKANNLPGQDTLKALNKKLSIMSDIEEATAQQAAKEARVPPRRLGWMGDVAMGILAPRALIAKKILVDSGLAREAAMVADDKLAAYVRAMDSGARGQALKSIAAQLSIGAAAADVLGAWAQGQPNGQQQ